MQSLMKIFVPTRALSRRLVVSSPKRSYSTSTRLVQIKQLSRFSSQRRWLSNEVPQTVAVRQSRWAAAKQRFHEKKAQMMVEYGSTFIFLHEFFGIMSYATVFTLISAATSPHLVSAREIFDATKILLCNVLTCMLYLNVELGVIPVESILGFFGWTEADLMTRFKIDIHGAFTTGALTYAVVKGLDAVGLIPFRWFLTITLTPRVAWWIGPRVDRAVAAVKRMIGRK
jgi:hypothetical protein